MENKTYTISQVAKILGVYVDTIRKWEKRGVIKIKRNSINNYRYFTQEDVDELVKKIKGSVV